MKKQIRQGSRVKILRNLKTRGCAINGLVGKVKCKDGDGTFWILVTKNSMEMPFHLERGDFWVIRKSKRRPKKT